MSDLTSRVKDLKANFVSQGSLRFKDSEKEATFSQYSKKLTLFFLPAFGLQFYQLKLFNQVEKAALFQRVARLKWLSALAALSLGTYELFDLDKKWLYIDRKYPEQTQYQRDLKKEVELMKLRNKISLGENESQIYKLQKIMNYKQMYMLPPPIESNVPDLHIPGDFEADDE